MNCIEVLFFLSGIFLWIVLLSIVLVGAAEAIANKIRRPVEAQIIKTEANLRMEAVSLRQQDCSHEYKCIGWLIPGNGYLRIGQGTYYSEEGFLVDFRCAKCGKNLQIKERDLAPEFRKIALKAGMRLKKK